MTNRILFNSKYGVVASKLIRVENTWFGNLVLVSASKAASYDFLDLQAADFYSHFKHRFSSGRPLAAAVMYTKGNPASPIMLLCSAHSAHHMLWDYKHSQIALSKIVEESIAAYTLSFQQPLPIDFSGMGVLFGGDLNTTLRNQCKWGRAVTIDVFGETFTFQSGVVLGAASHIDYRQKSSASGLDILHVLGKIGLQPDCMLTPKQGAITLWFGRKPQLQWAGSRQLERGHLWMCLPSRPKQARKGSNEHGSEHKKNNF